MAKRKSTSSPTSKSSNLKRHPDGYRYDDSDPFSDGEVTLVATAGGIQVRGRGWMSARLFADERRAHHWLSSRNGADPGFTPSAVAVGLTPDEKEDLDQDTVSDIVSGVEDAEAYLEDNA